jgi:hypothetical protein
VIRIFVNHDRIAIPIPIVDVLVVKRRHAKVKVVKEKTFAVSSANTELMSASEPTVESPVFPWVIEVKASIIPTLIMANPLIVVVNVRRLRMARLVAERPVIRLSASFRRAVFLRTRLSATIFLCRADTPRRGWTMRRDVAASNVSRAAATLLRRLLFFTLRERIIGVEQG